MSTNAIGAIPSSSYDDRRIQRTEGTDVAAVTAQAQQNQKPLFEYGGTDVAAVTASAGLNLYG